MDKDCRTRSILSSIGETRGRQNNSCNTQGMRWNYIFKIYQHTIVYILTLNTNSQSTPSALVAASIAGHHLHHHQQPASKTPGTGNTAYLRRRRRRKWNAWPRSSNACPIQRNQPWLLSHHYITRCVWVCVRPVCVFRVSMRSTSEHDRNFNYNLHIVEATTHNGTGALAVHVCASCTTDAWWHVMCAKKLRHSFNH